MSGGSYKRQNNLNTGKNKNSKELNTSNIYIYINPCASKNITLISHLWKMLDIQCIIFKSAKYGKRI